MPVKEDEEELLKGLQNYIKFQWLPSYCVVGNEKANYFASQCEL
jgi:hypothetical protein